MVPQSIRLSSELPRRWQDARPLVSKVGQFDLWGDAVQARPPETFPLVKHMGGISVKIRAVCPTRAPTLYMPAGHEMGG